MLERQQSSCEQPASYEERRQVVIYWRPWPHHREAFRRRSDPATTPPVNIWEAIRRPRNTPRRSTRHAVVP